MDGLSECAMLLIHELVVLERSLAKGDFEPGPGDADCWIALLVVFRL
jgi:hypothetical protein